MEHITSPCMTIEEVAIYLKTSVSTLRSKLKDSKFIKPFKDGRRLYWLRTDIESYVDTLAHAAKASA